MHYSLGVALAGIPGREKEAEAAYRASLELKPTHANAYNNLGLLLNSQQRYQEAADAYHGALAARPTHAKAMSNLGMVLQSQGQPQEAEQWHLRCALGCDEFCCNQPRRSQLLAICCETAICWSEGQLVVVGNGLLGFGRLNMCDFGTCQD